MKLYVPKIAWIIVPACVLAATGLACQAGAAQTTASQAPAAQAGVAAALQLHVSGNKLVNADGHSVVLHGVDYSGAEYQCVQNHGFFARPADKASVAAMKSWDVNAVRLPVNEACWNGESYVNPAYAGGNYRNAIKAYVSLLNANGIVVILDLHWSGGSDPGNRRDASPPRRSARSRCRTRPGPCRSGRPWRERSRATTRSSLTCSTSHTRG